MLGQPTETIEDMKAIGELAEEIAERYYEILRNKQCQYWHGAWLSENNA